MMLQVVKRRIAAFLLAAGVSGNAAFAMVVASDNASDATYNDGWSTADSGGTGFAAWSTINNQAGSGFGGGFLADNNGNSQINTGSPGKAFGIFGNGGGVGQAIRSFSSSIAVGHEFSIDMDNGSIDSGGTVGFGLQNSAGNNLFEFFFVGGESFYKTNQAGGSAATVVAFTGQGLRLKFLLTDADSFSLAIDQLADGPGVNVTTVTGDLISATGGQAISRLRLFNANGGNDAFFNSFSVTAVPEASAFLFGAVACAIAGIVCCRARRRGANLCPNE